MANMRIDSHKLIYHPARVADWLAGKNVYPLTVEISPSSACNHRCRFCAFDYLNYVNVLLNKELILSNLKLANEKGLKSVVVAGSGEPLLNRDTPDIIVGIKELGMDAALASNGVLFSRPMAEQCLPALTWVRFSVNGGTAESYGKIHDCGTQDFNKVLVNLQDAVKVKRDKRLSVTLGVQLLLIPENLGDVYGLARQLREIGVDYFTVKPYSQHPQSLNIFDSSFNYEECLALERRLAELSDERYQVIFRSWSMQKLLKERRYKHCHGLPFWAYIDAGANVWACLAYVGNPDFCYGNLAEQNFVELWEGPRRAEINKRVSGMDLQQCRELCRLDEINTYLEQLKNPGGHVNFI